MWKLMKSDYPARMWLQHCQSDEEREIAAADGHYQHACFADNKGVLYFFDNAPPAKEDGPDLPHMRLSTGLKVQSIAIGHEGHLAVCDTTGLLHIWRYRHKRWRKCGTVRSPLELELMMFQWFWNERLSDYQLELWAQVPETDGLPVRGDHYVLQARMIWLFWNGFRWKQVRDSA